MTDRHNEFTGRCLHPVDDGPCWLRDRLYGLVDQHGRKTS